MKPAANHTCRSPRPAPASRLAVAAALLLALAAAAPAEEAPAPAASQPAPLKGEFLMLANETGMTPEQRAKLVETLRERDVAIQSFNAQNEARIRQLQKEMLSARETHNHESILSLSKEHQTLESARRGIADRYDQKIVGLMTREQARTWEGYKLSRALMKDLGRVSLTPEQNAAIRAKAEKTAEALTGADDRVRNKTRAELRKSIESEVLTQAQRDELGKSVEKRPTDAATEPTKSN